MCNIHRLKYAHTSYRTRHVEYYHYLLIGTYTDIFFPCWRRLRRGLRRPYRDKWRDREREGLETSILEDDCLSCGVCVSPITYRWTVIITRSATRQYDGRGETGRLPVFYSYSIFLILSAIIQHYSNDTITRYGNTTVFV